MLARHRESEARRGPASLPVSGRAGDQPLIDILDRTSGRRPRRERPSVILIDVNVGVYAFRREHARHAVAREWLTRMATGPEPVAVGDDVLCALVRITTNHRVLRHPATPAEALSSCAALRSMPSVILLQGAPDAGTTLPSSWSPVPAGQRRSRCARGGYGHRPRRDPGDVQPRLRPLPRPQGHRASATQRRLRRPGAPEPSSAVDRTGARSLSGRAWTGRRTRCPQGRRGRSRRSSTGPDRRRPGSRPGRAAPG